MPLAHEEKLGLQISALARLDSLKGLSCETCQRQNVMNCECVESDMVVFSDSLFEIELTACPFHYIPQTVIDFVDEWNYLEKWPSTAKTYNEVSHKFWLASKYFMECIAKVEKRKSSKQPKQDKGLDALRLQHGIKQ